MPRKTWPEVLTLEQAAEYLQLSVDEVSNLLTTKNIPGVLIGANWRIRKESLNRWLDGQPNTPVASTDAKETAVTIEKTEKKYQGIISTLDEQKGMGEIACDEFEIPIFFHHSDIEPVEQRMNAGDAVSFTIVDTSRGLHAKKIRNVSNPVDMSNWEENKIFSWGTVDVFNQEKGTGRVKTPLGEKISFHISDIQNLSQDIAVGDEINFRIIQVRQRLAAKEIKPGKLPTDFQGKQPDEKTPISSFFTSKNKRMNGSVMTFDTKKRYGFIRIPEINRSIYVHASDIKEGQPSLSAGDKVEFKLVNTTIGTGLSAKEVVVMSKSSNVPIATTKTSKQVSPINKKLAALRKEEEEEFRKVDELREQGKTEEALEIEKKAITLRVNRLVREAEVMIQKKNPKGAKSLLNEAIDLGGDPGTYITLAKLEDKTRDYEKVDQIFEKAISAFPGEMTLLEEYASLMIKRKDLDGAIEHLQLALSTETKGTKARIHHRLAKTLISKGDIESLSKALFHADEARKLNAPLDKKNYDMLVLVTGPTIVQEAFHFFQTLGFIIKVDEVSNNFVDLAISTEHVEYTESYDLNDVILVRCYSNMVGKINEFDDFLKKIRNNANRKISNDVGFVIFRNLTEWRDALYRMIETNREALVPIEVHHSNPNEDDIAILFRQALDEWLSKRDLFQDKFPVSGRRFFGRTTELQTLMSNIDYGQHTGIFGLRRVGKTSLLYQLSEKRPNDIVAYIDLQEIEGVGIRDCSYLYWAISRAIFEQLSAKKKGLGVSRKLGLKLGNQETYNFADPSGEGNSILFDHDIRSILDVLTKNTQTSSSKIIIAMDELEYMLPVLGKSSGFKGYREFFAHLRGISQRTKGRLISAITAANPSVSEQGFWEEHDNPVFEFYKDMFLPPLRRPECDEMLHKLGAGMGVFFEEPALEYIYLESGGHPYITRQLCSHIAKSNQERPLTINTKLVIDHIETFLRDKTSIFREIVDRLQLYFPLEKQLLLTISSGVSSEDELSTFTDQPIENALRHLIGYQIVEYKQEKYEIRINLLHRWLHRNHFSE